MNTWCGGRHHIANNYKLYPTVGFDLEPRHVLDRLQRDHVRQDYFSDDQTLFGVIQSVSGVSPAIIVQQLAAFVVVNNRSMPLTFTYDAMGNRIWSDVRQASSKGNANEDNVKSFISNRKSGSSRTGRFAARKPTSATKNTGNAHSTPLEVAVDTNSNALGACMGNTQPGSCASTRGV